MNDELQKGNTVSNIMCGHMYVCMYIPVHVCMYEHNTTCTSTCTRHTYMYLLRVHVQYVCTHVHVRVPVHSCTTVQYMYVQGTLFYS